jgi:hypothetical protein
MKANIPTPMHKSYFDKAVLFWRIINTCQPRELFLDLLLPRFQTKWQQILHLQQSMEQCTLKNVNNYLNALENLNVSKFLRDIWWSKF